MTETNELTPIEAINEFYRLKDKYKNEYYEKYIKGIIFSNNTNREKRLSFSRLPKHECINCHRNVGTIFSVTQNNETLIRTFSIKCGDLNEPCKLDIQINYGVRLLAKSNINDALVETDNLKREIIKEKNNAIFFNKDVSQTFSDLSEELSFYTNQLGVYIETDILRNNNPEKLAMLKKSIDEFGKLYVLPFKGYISQFKETGNEEFIKEALEFYKDDIIPKLKEIQELKYDVNIVEFDEDSYIYKLIQLPNSLENLEVYNSTNDKVVKFVIGVEQDRAIPQIDKSQPVITKNKNKTKKTTSKTNGTSGKTKKLKVDLNDWDKNVDEPDEDNDVVNPSVNVVNEQVSKKRKTLNKRLSTKTSKTRKLRDKLILQEATEAIEEREKEQEQEQKQGLEEQEKQNDKVSKQKSRKKKSENIRFIIEDNDEDNEG